MKAKWIYLAILSTLIISLKLYAQIPVSGVVSGTWTQGNTYEVVGDLYIQNGTTLTIEPGVFVKFTGYYRFYVYGLLIANGTATDSIYFTCDVLQNPDRWGGIRFSNADSQCSMSYCVIERGLAQAPEILGGGVYCSNSSPTFSHCNFNNNSAENDGGAVNLNSSSPTFSHCDFYNNHSNDCGGGIGIYDNSSPEISNCTFSNNTSNTDGGGIRINDSSPNFTNCISSDNSANNGGGISCYNGTLTLNSCEITDNHLSGGYNTNGSGIHADNSTLTLTNSCNITGNYNSYRGGGIYVLNSSIDISNCTVTNNSASNNGGGLYFNQSSSEVMNCTISNNSVSYECGGGVLLWYPVSSIWSSCEFSNNSAIRGGGLYIGGGNLTSLYNCSFIANNAPSQIEGDGGGGIYLYGGAEIDLTDCLFEDNNASRGGGIYGYSWSGNSTIENCSFINNSADPYGGGGIYNYGANVSISECEFEGNQCTGWGGGLNNSNNASPTISKCVFVDNSASQGGGIINQEGGSPIISRCTMYRNTAVYGGGIACVNSSPIINSTIVDSSNGSGIYFGTGSSSSVIKYCNFNNNFPINFGGSDIPANLGTLTTTNYNDDPCDAFYNIFLDPLFENAINGNFELQSDSPCIDAGNPNIPPDPDGTIADIGAFYYDQPTGIGEQLDLPLSFKLHQNYPNPFNPSTIIEFSLPENVGNVKLSIYNVLGEKVAELVNTALTAGKYSYQWNVPQGGIATGMYIYELRTDKFVSVKKMILMK